MHAILIHVLALSTCCFDICYVLYCSFMQGRMVWGQTGANSPPSLDTLCIYTYHVYVWGVDSQIVPVGIPFVFYRSIMGLHSH